MRQKSGRRRRRGGVLVESVITTMALLSLMLGMIDMGIAVFRTHVISEAARQGARRAICQGALAPSKLNGGPWGPSAFSGDGNSSNKMVTMISGYMAGLDPSQVTINVTWPDGNNKVESRVTYQVSTTWTPMITWIFGSPSFNLSASSTMLIAH
jgi:Flp pilus assembly protein TadG